MLFEEKCKIKAIWRHAAVYLRSWFPALPSYQAFNARLNRLADAFPGLAEYFLVRINRKTSEEINLMDSLPIMLCSAKRKAKVATELSDKGYCSTKGTHYYGVKLHVIAKQSPQAFMGMELASGRNFSVKQDTVARFLINETAARKMGLHEDALGKKLTFWGQSGEVIGIVNDFHFRPMQFQIEPLILRYQPQEFYFNLLVKTKPGNIAVTLSAIETIYKKYEQEYPMEYGFVDNALDDLYQAERRTGKIVLYFACLAIFISCIGLFGLASFSIVQRTKEIGIRKVFGASTAHLLFLISRDYLKFILLAFAIAIPIANFFMTEWLQNFVYRIDIQWWLFAFPAVLIILIALLTISSQTLKAARQNAADSLRYE